MAPRDRRTEGGEPSGRLRMSARLWAALVLAVLLLACCKLYPKFLALRADLPSQIPRLPAGRSDLPAARNR
ncbi:hypothetical protein GN956_G17707 [Arapaima gigas]